MLDADVPDAADDDPSAEPTDRPSAEPPSSSSDAADRHSVNQLPADEVLPRRSADDSDVGWGDSPSGYDDDWYLNERPPHHG